MIVDQGTLNTAALVVPDLYVQIVPPQTYLIPGAPTNTIGVVGTASWGPTNQPLTIGTMSMYALAFGSPVARKYDMGTHVATAIQQGAQNFRCVRVTDGTDVAATSTGVATCITFTALYTGSLGNNLSVLITNGSKANTWKAIVSVPGGQPEVFDNIAGTGNALWTAMASAINTGVGQQRGKSNLIVATAAAGTTAPAVGTYTFTGGTDGATAITSSDMVGVSTTPMSGIYPLQGQGCSILLVADLDDTTQWNTVDGVANQQGSYNILAGGSGESISEAITNLQTAAVNDYSSKVMMGDWVLWNDPFNGYARYISPQGFVAGRLANLSPEQSSLNKKIFGVAGTQRSNSTNATYSSAELQQLISAGIDVITNPGAGGVIMWTCRSGHNCSTNSAIQGDNYTRLTNFIASSLNAAMGVFCGLPINDALVKGVSAALNAFFLGMYGQGMLGIDVDDGGLPWAVICGLGTGTNNPPERTKLNNFQADCQVQYMAINEKFIVNLEGGQTVTVSRQTTQSGKIIA